MEDLAQTPGGVSREVGSSGRFREVGGQGPLRGWALVGQSHPSWTPGATTTEAPVLGSRVLGFQLVEECFSASARPTRGLCDLLCRGRPGHYGTFSSVRGFAQGFLGDSVVNNLPATRETPAQALDWEDPLEKEMATHSNTLAWRTPRTQETGGLQSMGSQSQTRRLKQLSTHDRSALLEASNTPLQGRQ